MEMFLVKDAGFGLDDIRGRTETEVRWKKPTDVVSRLRDWLPWFEVEPVAEVVERDEQGMTEKEVHQFAILHDEQEKIRQEKADEEANKHG